MNQSDLFCDSNHLIYYLLMNMTLMALILECSLQSTMAWNKNAWNITSHMNQVYDSFMFIKQNA